MNNTKKDNKIDVVELKKKLNFFTKVSVNKIKELSEKTLDSAGDLKDIVEKKVSEIRGDSDDIEITAQKPAGQKQPKNMVDKMIDKIPTSFLNKLDKRNQKSSQSIPEDTQEDKTEDKTEDKKTDSSSPSKTKKDTEQ